MNGIFFDGRLTKDPELKYTQTGIACVSFDVAIDIGKDKDGNKKTMFLNCTAWKGTGETIAKYFKKGDQIICQGSLDEDRWDDKETGKPRSKMKVIVHLFQFGQKKGAVGNNDSPKDENPTGDSNPYQPETPDDKIPF